MMLSSASLRLPSSASWLPDRSSNPSRVRSREQLPLLSSFSSQGALQKTFPFAASVAILLWCHPVDAGVLSGFSGFESVPGPELPQLDFLQKWNADNQNRYAELDSRFKSSPKLKELLEKTRLNKDKNRKAIEDKYCIRGAEWGVGDCSTQGMTPAEKDDFLAMLKQRTERE